MLNAIWNWAGKHHGIVTAIVGVITVLALIYSLYLTRQALTASEESFKTSERAWLVYLGFRSKKPPNNEAQSVEFLNTGDTPAMAVATSYICKISEPRPKEFQVALENAHLGVGG